jgi:RNA polymerase sigma factor (sigma-70 family)
VLLAAVGVDRDAFGVFYERYERAIVGFFLRRVRDPELAADLTSEVFAAALAGAERFQPVGETAAGWLFTIARNTLSSSLRRGQVEDSARRHLGQLDVVELTEETLDRLERLVVGDAWVEDLLAQIPADQRDAIRARVLDDLSYAEIAAELESSALVARKRVSRGLSRLRAMMEERA